jgi:hypothetical protein
MEKARSFAGNVPRRKEMYADYTILHLIELDALMRHVVKLLAHETSFGKK